MQSNAQTDKNTVMQNAIALYTPKQIYDIEKNWFSKNDSFALMQQEKKWVPHLNFEKVLIRNRFFSAFVSFLTFLRCLL